MCRKPCAECPFSREIVPGATGGSDPGVYIGQAYGPFFLPCHMDPAYYENRRSLKLLQCAGAATFRANVGVADLMPDGMLKLPEDKVKVFADASELLAHHLNVSIEMAKRFLSIATPQQLMKEQFTKSGVEYHNPEKIKKEQNIKE